MSQPVPKLELGKELEAITEATGTAVVRYGKRTFVVVEMESQPSTPTTEVYAVTDPVEVADLKDAVEDTDNAAFSTDEAMQYLQSLREKRVRYGRS